MPQVLECLSSDLLHVKVTQVETRKLVITSKQFLECQCTFVLCKGIPRLMVIHAYL